MITTLQSTLNLTYISSPLPRLQPHPVILVSVISFRHNIVRNLRFKHPEKLSSPFWVSHFAPHIAHNGEKGGVKTCKKTLEISITAKCLPRHTREP